MARYFAESLRDDEDQVPWPADDAIAAWLAGLPKEPPAVRDLDDVERLRERAVICKQFGTLSYPV
jgi:hypothetical protein